MCCAFSIAICELRNTWSIPVFTRSILLTICNSSYISYKLLPHFPLHRARLNSFERRLGTRQKQVYSTILYIIFKCSLHMLRISRKFVAQMKSIMVIGTFFHTTLCLVIYFPFNSRLRVRPALYLSGPGYEVGFGVWNGVWSLFSVGPRASPPAFARKPWDQIWSFPRGRWYRIFLVLVATPSYFLYFAKGFIYSRRFENTQKYWN